MTLQPNYITPETIYKRLQYISVMVEANDTIEFINIFNIAIEFLNSYLNTNFPLLTITDKGSEEYNKLYMAIPSKYLNNFIINFFIYTKATAIGLDEISQKYNYQMIEAVNFLESADDIDWDTYNEPTTITYA